MGAVGEDKIAGCAHAVRQRIPMVWLLDSAGARIQATSGSSFAGAGALFREQVAMSGVVPMVAAMLGHCAAGTAYIPALADFVPMVKGTSSMALGGRHLVKAAVGEDVTEEEMGGSAVHTKISGVADLEVADDAECLQIVRDVPVVLPAAQRRSRRRSASTDDPVDRRVEELYDIVPTAPRRAYDMRKVVTAIVDDGDVLLDEARMGEERRHRVRARRRAAGRHRCEPADGARRRARRERGRQGRAVRVALRRVQHPARVPARRARASSSAPRSRSRASSATAPRCCSRCSEATVPKISVVLRKSYGAGYFVMNGLAYEADYIVAWPTAEIAVMGPDGAVNIIHRKTLKPCPKTSERTRSGSSSRRRSAPTSTRTSPPATRSSTT